MVKDEENLGKLIGEITHYFSRISVAVFRLSDDLKVKDRVRIKGETTDFEQEIESMQIDHEDVEEAEDGQSVGTKVDKKVREGDNVYLVE